VAFNVDGGNIGEEMNSAIKSVAKPAWTADADSCFAFERSMMKAQRLASQLVVDRVYEPET